MKDLKDYMINDGKTIADLYRSIEAFMELDVVGGEFGIEQDFEDAVRKMLKDEGFDVLPKKDVENTNKLIEGTFSDSVDRQIPDISVKCEEGLAMLELKYCRDIEDYNDDIKKVKNYIRQGKCDFAGVLFLDEVERTGWKTCGVYDNYYYLWKLYIPKFDAK